MATAIGDLVLRFSADISEVRTATDQLRVQMDRLQSEMHKSTSGMNKGLESISGAITNVKNQVLNLVGAYVSWSGVKMFAGMIESSVRAQAALDDVAERTGATVEGLSKLQNVGRLSGTSIDSISGALTRMERTLNQGNEKTNKAAIAFKSLGIEIRDASGKLLPADQILMNAAKTFHTFTDGVEKSQLMLTALGRTGNQLAPLMKDLIDNFDVVGHVTAKQAADLERLEKTWIKIDIAMQTAKDTFTVAIAPVLEALGLTILDVIKNTIGLQGGINKLAEDKKFLQWAINAVDTFVLLADTTMAVGKAFIETVRTVVAGTIAIYSAIELRAKAVRELVSGAWSFSETRRMYADLTKPAIEDFQALAGKAGSAMAGVVAAVADSAGPLQQAWSKNRKIMLDNMAAIQAQSRRIGSPDQTVEARAVADQKRAADAQAAVRAAQAAAEAAERAGKRSEQEWQKFGSDFDKMIGETRLEIDTLIKSISNLQDVEIPVVGIKEFSAELLSMSFAGKTVEEKIAAVNVAFGGLTTGSEITTKAMRDFEAASRTATFATRSLREQEELRNKALELDASQRQAIALKMYESALIGANEAVIGAQASMMAMALGTDKATASLQLLFKLQSSPAWGLLGPVVKEDIKDRLMQADAITKVADATKMLFDIQQKFRPETEAVRAGFIDQKTLDRMKQVKDAYGELGMTVERFNLIMKDDSVRTALDNQIEGFMIQAETFGMTDVQRELYTVGLDRTKLSLMMLSPEIRASIESLLDQREALAIARDELERYKTEQGNIAHAIQTAADYGQSFFESWAEGMKGVSDWAKKVGQDLKNWLLKVLYELTVKKWIIQITASIFGLNENTLGSMLTNATPNADLVSLLFGGGAKAFVPASAGGNVSAAAGAGAGTGGGLNAAVSNFMNSKITEPSTWFSRGGGAAGGAATTGAAATGGAVSSVPNLTYSPTFTTSQALPPEFYEAMNPARWQDNSGLNRLASEVGNQGEALAEQTTALSKTNLSLTSLFDTSRWFGPGGFTLGTNTWANYATGPGAAQLGGPGGASLGGPATVGPGGGVFGSFGQYLPSWAGGSFTPTMTWGSVLGGAAMGFGIGSLGAAFFGNERNQQGMQMGGTVGGLVGSMIPGIGPIIGSVLGTALGSLFKKGGGPMERLYGLSAGANLEEFGPGFSGVHKLVGTDAKVEQAFVDLSNSQTAKYNQIMKLMGRTGTAHFGTYTSTDPRGTAQSGMHAVATVGGKLAYNLDTGLTLGRDPQVLADRVALESERAVFAALQASDLPDAVAQIFAKFTASTMSAETIGIVENFGAAVGALVKKITDDQKRAGLAAKRAIDNASGGVSEAVDELAVDLPPIVQHLIDVIDGTDEQITRLSGLLPAVTAYVSLMAADPLKDAMELVEAQTNSLSTAFDTASDNLQMVIDDFDGSADAASGLSDALGTFYEATVRLIAGLLQAKQNIDDSIAGARRTIEMTGMTPEEKREYLRQENIGLREELMKAKDPARIQYLEGRLQSNLMESWSSLTPEQQKLQKGAYLESLAQLESDVGKVIDDAIEAAQTAQTEFLNVLGPMLTSAVDGMIGAADTQNEAADKQDGAATTQVTAARTPRHLTVTVRDPNGNELGGGEGNI